LDLMRTGVASSTTTDARGAAVEAAVGAAKTLSGGAPPDLMALFVSPHFAAQAELVLDSVHEAVGPQALIGCVAEAVVADATELEATPAIVAWAAQTGGRVETFAPEFSGSPDAPVFTEWPDGRDACILLADPFTFPVDALLRQLDDFSPGAIVIGGLASGASAPGATRLFRDKQVLTSGAVGARIFGGVELMALVSQGCRPVGTTYVVTKAEGNVIHELAGRAAVERIRELFAALPERDRALVSEGLLVGRVIDEYKSEFERGDFLVRGVIGADPASGAIAVGDQIEVGETIQFHVRDAESADEDLKESIARLKMSREGKQPSGALLFTCNGRGTRMFAAPDHDASLIAHELAIPLAGFFCAGEIGPVGGKNFLHGFTASMALFYEDGASS